MPWAASLSRFMNGITVAESAEPRTNSRGSHRATYVLLLVIGAWLAMQMLNDRSPTPVRCGHDLTPDANTVVMLSASWCGYCRQARRYFHDENIKYCEYDVENDVEGKRRFAAEPRRVLPILKLHDQTFLGFAREDIEQALAAKGLRALPD